MEDARDRAIDARTTRGLHKPDETPPLPRGAWRRVRPAAYTASMVVPTGGVRSWSGIASLVLMVALAPLAAADPITTPLSRFNVELPAGWKIGGARRLGLMGGGQYLGRPGRANIVLVDTPVTDCAAALHLGAGDAAYGADWLPAGWGGKLGADQMVSLCSMRAGFPIILMGGFTGAKQDYLELLAALDRAWKSSIAAAFFEVVILPGSHLTLTLPAPLAIVETSGIGSLTVEGYDTLELAGPRGAASFHVFSTTGGCEPALGEIAQAVAMDEAGDAAQDWAVETMTPSAAAAPTGWRMWTSGSNGRVVYCSQTTPAALVISPGSAAIRATGADDPTASLLAALHAELVPVAPSTGVTTLAVSTWRVAPPGDWKIATAPDADGLLDDAGGALVVMRKATSCDAVTTVGTTDMMSFDPAWMPAGWRAVISRSSLIIVLCTTVEGGAVQAVIPAAKMPRRRALIAVLTSLRRDNLAASSSPPLTTTAPAPGEAVAARGEPPSPAPAAEVTAPARGRSGPLLPFPIRLAYQTVGLDGERGHGMRLGVDRRFGTYDLAAVIRGELGYDTLTRLGHDVQLRIEWSLVSTIDVIGAVGHDAWGTREASPAVPDGWYGGIGLELTRAFSRSVVNLEVVHLWRTSEPVDGTMEPDAETRFGIMVWRRLGPFLGVSGEIRATGDATTVLLGTRLRL